MKIRVATAEDAALIQSIYAPYVEKTAITFEYDVPCVEDFRHKDDENLTDASVCFHKKMGYTTVGKHNLCGYKFDKWYSVIWMEKLVANRADRARDFISFSEIKPIGGVELQ